HLPPLQRWSAGHEVPQAPQCVSVLFRSTHDVPHIVRLLSQPHLPAVQLVSPWQALPHAPQLSLLESSVTHELPHGVSPDAHLSTQPPCEQSCVEGHFLPQPPQFAASADGSLHVPLHAFLPEGQAHLLSTHVMPVFVQSTPQPPQLCVSVVASTHTPEQKV